MSQNPGAPQGKPVDINAVVDAVLGGQAPADALELPDATLQALAEVAGRDYRDGKFREAERGYQLLSGLDPSEPAHWFGLGGARQAQKQYDAAAEAYGMAAATSELADPAPIVYGAVCRLRLGDTETARGMFEAALAVGEADNVTHRQMHDSARAFIEAIDKETL